MGLDLDESWNQTDHFFGCRHRSYDGGHGYLSIDQDRENIERELTVGMRGFSRVLQAGLRHTITEELDFKEMQRFIDAAAPRGNIHGVIVYNLSGDPVAHSASIRYGTDFPELDPTPIKKLDPRPVLQGG